MGREQNEGEARRDTPPPLPPPPTFLFRALKTTQKHLLCRLAWSVTNISSEELHLKTLLEIFIPAECSLVLLVNKKNINCLEISLIRKVMLQSPVKVSKAYVTYGRHFR